MSMLIASLMFVALLAAAFAHFLWSLGVLWPIRQEKLLAQTIVGSPDIERMPPRWLLLVKAIAALAAGIVALSLADPEGGGLTLTRLALPLAAYFLVRGILGYTPSWAARTPEPNFRLNDRRVYSPLCLLLGAGYLTLFLMRLL